MNGTMLHNTVLHKSSPDSKGAMELGKVVNLAMIRTAMSDMNEYQNIWNQVLKILCHVKVLRTRK